MNPDLNPDPGDVHAYLDGFCTRLEEAVRLRRMWEAPCPTNAPLCEQDDSAALRYVAGTPGGCLLTLLLLAAMAWGVAIGLALIVLHAGALLRAVLFS